MSEDEHTNGAMETNENSDSNENSVGVLYFFPISKVLCAKKREKKKIFHTLCSCSCIWCVKHSSFDCCCCFSSAHGNSYNAYSVSRPWWWVCFFSFCLVQRKFVQWVKQRRDWIEWTFLYGWNEWRLSVCYRLWKDKLVLIGDFLLFSIEWWSTDGIRTEWSRIGEQNRERPIQSFQLFIETNGNFYPFHD